MSELKKNIARLTKQYGTSYSKIEKEVGLSKHFISNIIHERTRSPNIDAVIKIARAFNMSIDELVGMPTKHPSQDINIDDLSLFLDVTTFILSKLKKNNISSANIFQTILDVYSYSKEQKKLDKQFAEWSVKTKILKDKK